MKIGIRKNIILFTLFLLFNFIQTSAQWQKLPGPDGGSIKCIEKVGSVIWAGTRDGIYVSADEGLSWTKSGLVDGSCIDILSVNDTVVVAYTEDPANPKILSRSSFDNGSTWNNAVVVANSFEYDVPGKFHKTEAAIYLFAVNWSRVLYKSTNGGSVWQQINSNFEEVVSNGKGILARGMANPTTHQYEWNYSKDGSQPWVKIDSIHMANTAAFFGNRIFLLKSGAVEELYYSDDNGLTWNVSFSINITTYGHSIRQVNGNLYLYGYQDTYLSADSGLTWNLITAPPDINFYDFVTTGTGNKVVADGFKISTYFPSLQQKITTMSGVIGLNIEYLGANKNVLFCSTRDTLYRSTDGGLTWHAKNNLLSGVIKMHFKGDTIYAIRNWYNSTFARSYDNGITWDTLPVKIGQYSNMVSVNELDGRIYLAGYYMIYSDDQGLTWDTLPPLPAISSTGCIPGSFQAGGSTISVFNNEIYTVTDMGYVFRLDTSSQIWNSLFCFWSTGANTNNHITNLDGRLILNSRRGLFISADTGATWLTTNYIGLPSSNGSPVIPQNITSINTVWYGSCGSFGIFYSLDYGHTWQVLPPNSDFIAGYALTSLNNTLYVSSYFDGIWRRVNSFYTVSGNVFHDQNFNGQKDIGELPIKNAIISSAPFPNVASTNSLGNYSLKTDMPGTLTAYLQGTLGNFYPQVHQQSGDTSGLNFAFQIPSNIKDLKIDLTNTSRFNPGFDTGIILTAFNSGSVSQSATIKLKLDTLLTFLSAVPSPSSVINDTIIWVTPQLNFQDQFSINISVNTDVNSLIGSPTSSYAYIIPIINDSLPADNECILNDTIIGSYDPNDKTCLQGTRFTTAQLAAKKELQYVIRFQNNGTVATSFIMVSDTLSPYFDLSSLRIISSSHPMTWEISSSGLLEFNFNPLQLPPAIMDEPGSHGYIKYAIKCKDAVTVGNALKNTAYIYFDYNSPVITNTALTFVSDPLTAGNAEFSVNIDKVSIFPNPAINVLNMRFNQQLGEKITVLLFNSMGKQINTYHLKSTTCQIDVSTLSCGLYIGKIIDTKGNLISNIRFIKQ